MTLTRRQSRGRQILRRAARIYRKQGCLRRRSLGDTRPEAYGTVCAAGAIIRARKALKYSRDDQVAAECMAYARAADGHGVSLVKFNDLRAKNVEQVASLLDEAAAA